MTTSEHVFIVSPTESALTTRGTRHPDLARYLVQRGYSVVYVSTTFSHAEKRLFSAAEIASRRIGIPYELILLDVGQYERNVSLKRVRWNRRLSSECYRLLRQRLTSRDTVVVPSRPPELIYVAARLKKITGCSVVVDIRDIWPDALPAGGSLGRRFFAAYCDRYLRDALPEITHFVHTAPSFEEWLRRYAPSRNSTFIPLGFDPDRWKSVKPHCSNKSDSLSIVYVGLLQDQVDIMPLLLAIHGRPKVDLTIVGDGGKGERYQQVIRFINENHIRNVRLVGQVPPHEVPELLVSKHIGVVPMIMPFAMPNKVFDYIGAFMPILSLGENDCSCFVRRYDIGWALPHNSNAVRDWLDGVNHDDIITKRDNVAKVRDHYSRANLLPEFAAVIERAKTCAG